MEVEMQTPSTSSELDIRLDIFGQQPRLNIHTQLCLCYAMPESVSQSNIISILTTGLETLTASFPWVAGQVINEGAGPGDSGTFKIKNYEKIPRLVVKDLRDDPTAPTMAALRIANFPMKMLDESVIAPRNTFPRPDVPEEFQGPSPVFLMQANFIKGGLILTFLSQHQTMDITAHGQIMHLLSKACHGEAFTAEELRTGNMKRENIIPLLENYEPGPELASHLVVRPGPPSIDDSVIQQPPNCTWTILIFPSSSLSSLKAIALATHNPSIQAPYLSTDDVLSAFIWQRITAARSPRLLSSSSPSTTTKDLTITFGRAIDIRRPLNVPSTYPGLIQNMTYTHFPLSTLLSAPLSTLASAMRSALDPQTSPLPFHTRALATYLSTQKDKSGVSPAARIDPSSDVLCSSWMKSGCAGLDFGLGAGGPEAVRRPWFRPLEGFVYFLPRIQKEGDGDGDGEMAVAVCLREGDMERLKGDEEVGRWARDVG